MSEYRTSANPSIRQYTMPLTPNFYFSQKVEAYAPGTRNVSLVQNLTAQMGIPFSKKPCASITKVS